MNADRQTVDQPLSTPLARRFREAALAAVGFFISGALFMIPGIGVIAGASLRRGWLTIVLFGIGWTLFGAPMFIFSIGTQAHNWMADLGHESALSFAAFVAIPVGGLGGIAIGRSMKNWRRGLLAGVGVVAALALAGVQLNYLWAITAADRTLGFEAELVAAGLAFSTAGALIALFVPPLHPKTPH